MSSIFVGLSIFLQTSILTRPPVYLKENAAALPTRVKIIPPAVKIACGLLIPVYYFKSGYEAHISLTIYPGQPFS